jgi:hypothetical protein
MQDWRGRDPWCVVAIVFLLETSKHFAFGVFHLGRAQGAIGGE